MAKKASSKPAEPDVLTKANPDLVTVRVLAAALGENGTTYLKGETFETTATRAAALGDSVEPVQ